MSHNKGDDLVMNTECGTDSAPPSARQRQRQQQRRLCASFAVVVLCVLAAVAFIGSVRMDETMVPQRLLSSLLFGEVVADSGSNFTRQSSRSSAILDDSNTGNDDSSSVQMSRRKEDRHLSTNDVRTETEEGDKGGDRHSDKDDEDDAASRGNRKEEASRPSEGDYDESGDGGEGEGTDTAGGEGEGVLSEDNSADSDAAGSQQNTGLEDNLDRENSANAAGPLVSLLSPVTSRQRLVQAAAERGYWSLLGAEWSRRDRRTWLPWSLPQKQRLVMLKPPPQAAPKKKKDQAHDHDMKKDNNDRHPSFGGSGGGGGNTGLRWLPPLPPHRRERAYVMRNVFYCSHALDAYVDGAFSTAAAHKTRAANANSSAGGSLSYGYTNAVSVTNPTPRSGGGRTAPVTCEWYASSTARPHRFPESAALGHLHHTLKVDSKHMNSIGDRFQMEMMRVLRRLKVPRGWLRKPMTTVLKLLERGKSRVQEGRRQLLAAYYAPRGGGGGGGFLHDLAHIYAIEEPMTESVGTADRKRSRLVALALASDAPTFHLPNITASQEATPENNAKDHQDGSGDEEDALSAPLLDSTISVPNLAALQTLDPVYAATSTAFQHLLLHECFNPPHFARDGFSAATGAGPSAFRAHRGGRSYYREPYLNVVTDRFLSRVLKSIPARNPKRPLRPSRIVGHLRKSVRHRNLLQHLAMLQFNTAVAQHRHHDEGEGSASRSVVTKGRLMPAYWQRMHCLASMAAAITDRVVAVTRSDDRILTAVAERTGHVAGLLPPALWRERRVSRLGAMSGDWNSSALPSWLRLPSRVNVGNCFSRPTSMEDPSKNPSSLTPRLLLVGPSHARNLYTMLCTQLLHSNEPGERLPPVASVMEQCRVSSEGLTFVRALSDLKNTNPTTQTEAEAATSPANATEVPGSLPSKFDTALSTEQKPHPPCPTLALCTLQLDTLEGIRACVSTLAQQAASVGGAASTAPDGPFHMVEKPTTATITSRTLHLHDALNITTAAVGAQQLRGLFTHIVVVPGVWEATFGDETAPERAENTALLLEVLEELFAPRRMVLYNMHGIHTPEGTDEWAFDAALQGEGPAAGVALGRTRAPLLACRSRVRSYRDAQLCGASVYGRRRVREAWAARLGVAPGGGAGGPRPVEIVDFHAATRSSLGRLFVDDAGHHYNEVVLEAMTQRLLRDYVCPPRYALAVPEGADGAAAVSRGDVLELPGLPSRSPVARGGSPVAVELVPGGLEVSLPVLERRAGGALAVRGLLPLMRAPDPAVAEAVCRTIWDSAEGVAAGGVGAVAWAYRRSRAPAEPAASEAPVPASRAANPFAIVPDCACLRTRRLVESTGNASVALEDTQVGGRRSCAFRGHLFSEPGRCADIRTGLGVSSCSRTLAEEVLHLRSLTPTK